MSCKVKRYILWCFVVVVNMTHGKGREEVGRSSAPDLFGDHSHNELVCGSREEKGDKHGAGARELVRSDG